MEPCYGQQGRRHHSNKRDDQRASQTGIRCNNTSGKLQPEYSNLSIHGAMAVLLSPFAPHVAEELWEELGHTESVFKAGWPKYDENAMKDDEIKVPVQINGKTKAVIEISADASKEEALAAGKEAIADKLTGNVIKEIYVPKKIINIVMK